MRRILSRLGLGLIAVLAVVLSAPLARADGMVTKTDATGSLSRASAAVVSVERGVRVYRMLHNGGNGGGTSSGYGGHVAYAAVESGSVTGPSAYAAPYSGGYGVYGSTYGQSRGHHTRHGVRVHAAFGNRLHHAAATGSPAPAPLAHSGARPMHATQHRAPPMHVQGGGPKGHAAPTAMGHGGMHGGRR